MASLHCVESIEGVWTYRQNQREGQRLVLKPKKVSRATLRWFSHLLKGLHKEELTSLPKGFEPPSTWEQRSEGFEGFGRPPLAPPPFTYLSTFRWSVRQASLKGWGTGSQRRSTPLPSLHQKAKAISTRWRPPFGGSRQAHRAPVDLDLPKVPLWAVGPKRSLYL